MNEIQMLTAKDIQRIFHMGKNTAYSLMNSKGFPTLRINERLYVDPDALRTWIKENVGQQYIL